ncbi:DNA binding domain [Orobanche gracilis]
METSFVKEDNKEFGSKGDENCGEEVVLQHAGTGRDLVNTVPDAGTGRDLVKAGKGGKDDDDDDDMQAAAPNMKNYYMSCNSKQMDEHLGLSKAELVELMEENQQLKIELDRILKDYKTLQMQYQDIMQQEDDPRSPNSLIIPTIHDHDQITQEHDELMIALSLGRSSPSDGTKDEQRKTSIRDENVIEGEDNKEGLTLGLDLDCKFQVPSGKLTREISPNNRSRENSLEEAKEEGGESTWKPKTTKNVREGGDDEITPQNPAKRARVSVRVRCDTPTMNDGCQWRKYGQKIAKGNPCPRAYYRCTVAPSCPVRKQVQRCAEDMSILITTYEGTHNHPLPTSATDMASTTSAAASMLMSGSSTSETGSGPSSTTPTIGKINGLNFYLSDNNSRSKPFYLPNSSVSSYPSFPTITLDLTSSSSTSSSTSSHLSRLAKFPHQRYSTTNLNFSSLESNPLSMSWTNRMLSYRSPQPFNNNNQTTCNNSLNFGTQPYETLYPTFLQKNTIANPSQQNVTQDTIAAATKAITSDPSFQSALADVLSSIIGSNGANASTLLLPNQNEGEKPSRINNNLTSDHFPILSSFPSSTSDENKCPPSFRNKSSSSRAGSSQPNGALMFLSPPFSNTKSKSNSPGDRDGDHAV